MLYNNYLDHYFYPTIFRCNKLYRALDLINLLESVILTHYYEILIASNGYVILKHILSLNSLLGSIKKNVHVDVDTNVSN